MSAGDGPMLAPRTTTLCYTTPQYLDPADLVRQLENIERWIADGLPGAAIHKIIYDGSRLEIEVQ